MGYGYVAIDVQQLESLLDSEDYRDFLRLQSAPVRTIENARVYLFK
jgi:hypothetical protein